MEKFNCLLVWTITAVVRIFPPSCALCLEKTISFSLFSVNWSQTFDADHYIKQEEIYKKLRPTLLSNTLVVPTQKVRDHIRDLAANDHLGIKQQIEGYYRTRPQDLQPKSTLVRLEAPDHLFTHQIEVVPSHCALSLCTDEMTFFAPGETNWE